MKCKYVQQHLLDYSESQLDEKTHAQIEEHLRECPACIKDLKDFEHTVQLLQSTPLQAPPERFWEDFSSGVMRKVRRMAPPSRQIDSAFFPNMKMAVVALATLIAVLGLTVLYTSGSFEKLFPSFFNTSTPLLTQQSEQQRENIETMAETLLSEDLVEDILDSDFALLGGKKLSELPEDANGGTLYLLIESLDEREKTRLLSELGKMRDEYTNP